MNRPLGLTLGAGLCLGLAAASAMAVPPVLDRVPADALVVVTVPSLDRLDRSMQTLTTQLRVPMPVAGVRQFLTMSGIEQGIDTTRSIAAVIPAGALGQPGQMDDEDSPPIVMLVPVTDYAALMRNFNAQPTDGIDAVEIAGNPAFFRNVGDGYAISSDRRDLLERFQARAGNRQAHERALGTANRAVAERSDILVIANIEALRPFAQESINQQLEMIEMMAPMMMGGMGGAEGPDLAGARTVVNTFFEQASTAVAGITVGQLGVSVDLSSQFKPDTFLARAFARGGDTAGLIRRLPRQPYLFTFAVDTNSPERREIAKAMGQQQQGMPNIVGAGIERLDGYSMSMGYSPGALVGGGLFVNTVAYYQTRDPQAYINSTREMLQGVDGQNVGGTTFSTRFAEGTTTIAGASVSSWEMKMAPDPNDPMSAQAMGMFFGPAGGPAGFIAPVENGVVQSFSRNSILMGAAIESAKGGGNNMGGDQILAQVGQQLPPNRVSEGYIGMQSILETVKPMLAMFGGPELNVPENLPPIGMGVGATEGASHVGIFLPMPVLKVFGEVGAAIQAMRGDFEDEEVEEMPNRDGGAGRPRF